MLRRAELHAIGNAGMLAEGGAKGATARYAVLYRTSPQAIASIHHACHGSRIAEEIALVTKDLSPDFLAAIQAKSFDLIQNHVNASFAKENENQPQHHGYPLGRVAPAQNDEADEGDGGGTTGMAQVSQPKPTSRINENGIEGPEENSGSSDGDSDYVEPISRKPTRPQPKGRTALIVPTRRARNEYIPSIAVKNGARRQAVARPKESPKVQARAGPRKDDSMVTIEQSTPITSRGVKRKGRPVTPARVAPGRETGTHARKKPYVQTNAADVIDLCDSDEDEKPCIADLDLDLILSMSNLKPYKKYFLDASLSKAQDLHALRSLKEKRVSAIFEKMVNAMTQDGKLAVRFMHLQRFMNVLEEWDFETHTRRIVRA